MSTNQYQETKHLCAVCYNLQSNICTLPDDDFLKKVETCRSIIHSKLLRTDLWLLQFLHCNQNTYPYVKGNLEAYLHQILILGIGWGECLVSRSGRFIPGHRGAATP